MTTLDDRHAPCCLPHVQLYTVDGFYVSMNITSVGSELELARECLVEDVDEALTQYST